MSGRFTDLTGNRSNNFRLLQIILGYDKIGLRLHNGSLGGLGSRLGVVALELCHASRVGLLHTLPITDASALFCFGCREIGLLLIYDSLVTLCVENIKNIARLYDIAFFEFDFFDITVNLRKKLNFLDRLSMGNKFLRQIISALFDRHYRNARRLKRNLSLLFFWFGPHVARNPASGHGRRDKYDNADNRAYF